MFEIQKYGQILCAHKPYFLMPGHILYVCTYVCSYVAMSVQIMIYIHIQSAQA